MADEYIYTPPEHLQNSSVDDVYNEIKASAPPDVDTNEGGFFFDATRPVAEQKAEMVQMKLNETVKLIFPFWAYDEWLDYHADMSGLTRNAAIKAKGSLHLTGTPGQTIVKGEQFAVPAKQSTPAVVFETTADVTLDVNGEGTVTIQAIDGGESGNVASNTITIMVQPVDDITGITNPTPTTGGVDQEDNESLRARILDANQGAVGSGSKTDYEVWAKDVPGIGDAFCVPLGGGPGTVYVYLIDTNGAPASAELVAAAQAEVAPADGTGKAPIGATVTFYPVQPEELAYSMHITAAAGFTLDAVKANVLAKLTEYHKSVGIGGLVKYYFALQKAIEAVGLEDISNFTINAGTANIQIGEGLFPTTGTVTWT